MVWCMRYPNNCGSMVWDCQMVLCPLVKSRQTPVLWVYNRNKMKIEPVSQHYFKTIFGMTDDQCSDIFSLPFKVTLDTKLRWFQLWRVINNILPNNVWLEKVSTIDNEMCTFCHNDNETVTHMFCECNNVTDFWKQIKNRISRMRGFMVHLIYCMESRIVHIIIC